MALLSPNLLKSAHRLSLGRAIFIVVPVVVVGVVVVISIFAAGTPIAFEAESGTLAAGAKTAAPTGASGGSAVQFAAGAAATPTPTPGGTASTCPAYPAFPNAACTGVPAGTTLRTIPTEVSSGSGWSYSNGTVTIAGNNVTFSGYRFDGTVLIKGGDGDVITNNSLSQINGGNGDFILKVGYGATNVTISHNTIFGSGINGPNCVYYGVNGETSGGNVGPGYVVSNNNIYGIDHPIQSETGTYQDNYIHNVCGNGQSDPSLETHSDVFFSGGGDTGQLNLIHNYLLNDDTSANGVTASIMLNNAFGIQTNRLIEHNLIGGGGYAFYGGEPGNDNPASSNIVFRNNSFSTLANPQDQSGKPNAGYYGYTAAWNTGGAGNVWSGNIWADGPKAGQTVPEP